MARSIFDAAVVAGGTGLAHIGTHKAAGNPDVFEPAGVEQAGVAVVLAAFLLSLAVGQEGGLSLFQLDPIGEPRLERARRRLIPEAAGTTIEAS